MSPSARSLDRHDTLAKLWGITARGRDFALSQTPPLTILASTVLGRLMLLFDDLVSEVQFPALVLSTRAGAGNFTVGQAIEATLRARGPTHHVALESRLPDRLVRRQFVRYRRLCQYFPWVLRVIYRFPVNYAADYLREFLSPSFALQLLADDLAKNEIRTVICTNHRAVFYIAALKRRGEFRGALWAVLTDYHLNAGWHFLFWNEIDQFLGPIEVNDVPPRYRHVYRQIELPLPSDLSPADPRKSSASKVMISGGGWGLGPIASTVSAIVREFPQLELYVVCGDNEALYQRLARRFRATPAVHLHRTVSSPAPFFAMCRSIITKPGGITLAESHQAGKQIFLLKGLPVTEEANADHAIRLFGALVFSIASFSRWYAQQSTQAGTNRPPANLDEHTDRERGQPCTNEPS